MERKLPKKYFQIHLSTAVVLMFAAGCLIWLQLPHDADLGGDYFTTDSAERHTEIIDAKTFLRLSNRLVLIGYIQDSYGWPMPVKIFSRGARMDRNGRIEYSREAWRLWYPEKFVADVLFGFLILWITYKFCEWRIRR